MIKQAVDFILDLGPTIMLPIIMTLFGMILRQGFKKSFRAGITIGIGFVGVNLVITPIDGMLTEILNDAVHIINPGYSVDLMANFYFSIVSLIVELTI